jgi:site-specific DNA-methyltransferase (adenine-specific)/adenine-specific DNA-methyltransferase
MPESLIDQLPKIVAEGKKEVERILERLSGPNRLGLQTNEYVLPSKDKSGLFRGDIKEPLSLIEYWSVDPDYDGETFRSKWQDYRGNTENDDDPFRVVKETRILASKVKGRRKICVKAVDVFGFESVVVEEVGNAE